MHADRRQRYLVGSVFDTGALTHRHCKSSDAVVSVVGSEGRGLRFYFCLWDTAPPGKQENPPVSSGSRRCDFPSHGYNIAR